MMIACMYHDNVIYWFPMICCLLIVAVIICMYCLLLFLYIDWHCRYPSCCNSRLKLDVPSSPHVVHAACGGDMVRGSARPPIYDFCRKDHKTIFG